MDWARSFLANAAQFLPFLLVLVWCWFDPGDVIAHQRRAVFDYYQRLAPRAYQETPIRIIDIDDASLARIGQWPWPRTAVAAMVSRLGQAGAAAVVFDIVFAEPDRTSPAQVLPVWAASGAVLDKLSPALAALPDHDLLLARAIHDAGSVVDGFALTQVPGGRKPTIRSGFATLGDNPEPFIPAYRGAINNLSILEAAAKGNGSITFSPDDDFVIRRMPLVERIGSQFYPTLVSETLRVIQGASAVLVKSTGASREYGSGNQKGVVSVRIGRIAVPTDNEGQLFIHFTRPVPRRTIAAWRIFAEDFDPALVANKVVLIGTSATGLRDIRPSPVNPIMPGIEAHAQALEQVLLGHYLQRPDWASAAEFCFVLVVGSLSVLLLRLSGVLWSGVWGLFAVAAVFTGSWHAYTANLMLVDPVTPSLATLVIYISSTVLGYLRTEAEKQRVRGAFSQYLSPALLEELTRDPARLKLGGDLREMTLMFCDIRGFTRISETFKSNPQGLTRLLNFYLTPMSEAILNRRGTIDKYIGDCIMAFWNAPLEDPNHALNACSAALAMQKTLAQINESPEAGPFRPLQIGIGLNTGECVVGNMGSDQRFDYSVLGDAVNLAARLESQSKTYGVTIVMTEFTRAFVPDWAVLELDLIVVKGKTDMVRIYTLLGDESVRRNRAFAELSAAHSEMLLAYRRREWHTALIALKACKDFEPRLCRFYDLYTDRIEKFSANPPPPDWQGVYFSESK